MVILRWIMAPIAIIYGLVMEIRNFLFNKGILRSSEFSVPSIAVGNLSVGGSGKTPMVKFLIDELRDEYNILVISRGFGRKTTGFRWVEFDSKADEAGDEPLEIKLYAPDVLVAVSENRVDGITQAIKEKPEIDLILLDDAFQHRALKASFYVLLTEYAHPFFKDFVIPIGRLRELRKGAMRADHIVITKSPEEIDRSYFLNRVRGNFSFSSFTYGTPRLVHGPKEHGPKYVALVSGLARPKYLEKYIAKQYGLLRHFDFPDHKHYKQTEFDRVVKFCKLNDAMLFTTEKDWVKLRDLKCDPDLTIYVQPVKVNMQEGQLMDDIRNRIAVMLEENGQS